MALEDKDLLALVMSKHGDQPLEYIMERYAAVKRINAELERGLDAGKSADAAVIDVPALDAAAPAAPKRRLTRRSFVARPEEAITEDSITCCVCGWKGVILTAAHLEKHGTTPEDYRKACGYAPDEKLMSRARARFLREHISGQRGKRRVKVGPDAPAEKKAGLA